MTRLVGRTAFRHALVSRHADGAVRIDVPPAQESCDPWHSPGSLIGQIAGARERSTPLSRAGYVRQALDSRKSGRIHHDGPALAAALQVAQDRAWRDNRLVQGR